MQAIVSSRKSKRIAERNESEVVDISDDPVPQQACLSLVGQESNDNPHGKRSKQDSDYDDQKQMSSKKVDDASVEILEDEDDYKIDCVRAVKTDSDGKKHYLIKWLGWGEEENRWIPEDGLTEETKNSPIVKYDPEFNKGTYMNFYEYLFERFLIYLRAEKKKEAEPFKDYVIDPWIEQMRLMNTYDVLDAGTKWFHDQLAPEIRILNSKDISDKEKIAALRKFLFKSICYCTMNRRTTFEEFKKPMAAKHKKEKSAPPMPLAGIPEPEEWEAFKEYIKDRKSNNVPCFTAGHQNVGYRRYFESLDHVKKNLNKITDEVWKRLPDMDKVCTEVLRKIPQIGPFFAQQVCNDLCEINILKRSETFASMGPGARFGVNLIWPNTGDSQSATMARCVQLYNEQEQAFKELGINFPWLNGEKIGLHNFEHALCQWQQYFLVTCKLNRQPERFLRQKRQAAAPVKLEAETPKKRTRANNKGASDDVQVKEDGGVRTRARAAKKGRS